MGEIFSRLLVAIVPAVLLTVYFMTLYMESKRNHPYPAAVAILTSCLVGFAITTIIAIYLGVKWIITG